MRVISGSARGTKLKAPEGLQTRPTSDRVKETLFNMIQQSVAGCTFLDLFSGSGAIGIEALSRQATQAYFVESDRTALECIKENLQKTKLTEQAHVVTEDVLSFLKNNYLKADLVFLDPPYADSRIAQIVTLIGQGNMLAEDAIVILEQDAQLQIHQADGLVVVKVKEFKTTKLVFYQKANEHTPTT